MTRWWAHRGACGGDRVRPPLHRNREGDIHLLRQLGGTFGFRVEEIPAQEIDDVKVSSTKVRKRWWRAT